MSASVLPRTLSLPFPSLLSHHPSSKLLPLPRTVSTLRAVPITIHCHLCAHARTQLEPVCPSCAHASCPSCHAANIEGDFIPAWTSPRIPWLWECACRTRRSIRAVPRTASGAAILMLENRLDTKPCTCGDEVLRVAALYNVHGRRLQGSQVLQGCNLLSANGRARAVRLLRMIAAVATVGVPLQEEGERETAVMALGEVGYVRENLEELNEALPMNWWS